MLPICDLNPGAGFESCNGPFQERTHRCRRLRQEGREGRRCCRRDEAGNALVRELRSLGSEAEFINADVRKEDDVRAMVDKTSHGSAVSMSR
jgi:hypothetical protein